MDTVALLIHVGIGHWHYWLDYYTLFSSVILIGFQEALYQFSESNETHEAIYQSHEAVILKVNGTITEQTYLIDVSARDGSALNGFDYIMEGGDAQRFTILPDQQSLQFQFEILKDSILESVESFTIYLKNVPDYEPWFETQGAITTTKIYILDRTRKTSLMVHVQRLFFFLLAFVIGFREELTTAPEDVGSFNISVAILSTESVTVDPDLTFNILYSASGVAGNVC